MEIDLTPYEIKITKITIETILDSNVLPENRKQVLDKIYESLKIENLKYLYKRIIEEEKDADFN